MSQHVLISPGELSDMMRNGPVVLIDTRDPAIYAEVTCPRIISGRIDDAVQPKSREAAVSQLLLDHLRPRPNPL